LVESVDLYPTLCALCDVPLPPDRDGASLFPLIAGEAPGKEAVFCEWDWTQPPGKISAIRTHDFRLVFYAGDDEGELYDHCSDPGETRNLWADPAYLTDRVRLTERLLRFTLGYRVMTETARDRWLGQLKRHSPTDLLHKHRRYWSRLQETYTEPTTWPPHGVEERQDERRSGPAYCG
jgi:arylsulfatase A-like enzyme